MSLRIEPATLYYSSEPERLIAVFVRPCGGSVGRMSLGCERGTLVDLLQSMEVVPSEVVEFVRLEYRELCELQERLAAGETQGWTSPLGNGSSSLEDSRGRLVGRS